MRRPDEMDPWYDQTAPLSLVGVEEPNWQVFARARALSEADSMLSYLRLAHNKQFSRETARDYLRRLKAAIAEIEETLYPGGQR